MKRDVFAWGLGLALALSTSAWAGESGLSSPGSATLPVERLVPHQGGWWNSAEAGSGYFMEFSQNADGSLIGLATTYTYDDAGKSTFLIVQGPVVFTTEEERWATGIIARLSSPLYKAENGQPFGGTYRPATVSPSSFWTTVSVSRSDDLAVFCATHLGCWPRRHFPNSRPKLASISFGGRLRQ